MKTIKTLTALIAALFLFTGCQQDTSAIDGFDSRSSRESPNPTPTPGATPGPAPEFLTTEYNGFTGTDIEGKIKVYRDNAGSYIADLVRIRLTRMPTGLDSNKFVKFFRGFVTDSGVKNFDYANPLSIVIEDPSTSSAISGSLSNISKNTLSQLNPAIAPADIKNYNLILSGTTINYEIIRAVLYDGSGNPVSTVDFLIPAFRVNPNEYASHHPELKEMHPFWDRRSSGYTSNEFLTLSYSYSF